MGEPAALVVVCGKFKPKINQNGHVCQNHSLTSDTSDQIHQRPRASPVTGGTQCCGASPSQGN